MSTGGIRKVSSQEIQLVRVQTLIEQCLQLYMTQKEIMTALFVQEKIEPAFTEHVWGRLEEQNPEFFKAYQLKLLVKEQIREFNNLLAKHAELKHQASQNGGGGGASGGGAGCGRNGGGGGGGFVPVIANGSSHITSTGSLSPNFGIGESDGGRTVKTETDCYVYSTDDNNVAGDAGAAGGNGGGSSCFSGAEATTTILDADSSSFGYFDQISPNYNTLSDLTADFPNGFDIVESYSGSPFLTATGSDGYASGDHPGQYLNGRCKSMGYEDFSSDQEGKNHDVDYKTN